MVIFAFSTSIYVNVRETRSIHWMSVSEPHPKTFSTHDFFSEKATMKKILKKISNSPRTTRRPPLNCHPSIYRQSSPLSKMIFPNFQKNNAFSFYILRMWRESKKWIIPYFLISRVYRRSCEPDFARITHHHHPPAPVPVSSSSPHQHHHHRLDSTDRHTKSCDYANKRPPETTASVDTASTQHFGLPILSISEPSPPDERERLDEYL